MEVRCSTDLVIRKCDKYLGNFDILIGELYCKSCKKSNKYEIITKTGLQKIKYM